MGAHGGIPESERALNSATILYRNRHAQREPTTKEANHLMTGLDFADATHQDLRSGARLCRSRSIAMTRRTPLPMIAALLTMSHAPARHGSGWRHSSGPK